MYMQCAVVACASGGPLETVGRDKTRGYLCESQPSEFARAMLCLVHNPSIALEMGRAGQVCVLLDLI